MTKDYNIRFIQSFVIGLASIKENKFTQPYFVFCRKAQHGNNLTIEEFVIIINYILIDMKSREAFFQ